MRQFKGISESDQRVMKNQINPKILAFLILVSSVLCCYKGQAKIDRYSLVHRHNILITKPDTLSSLSVGNGEFAFTTDITGLQTFYKEYENGVTLGTQSNWGWHTFPNTENYTEAECTKYVDYRGRKVPYLVQFRENGRDAAAANYFRENPQRLQLGVIRLILVKSDGTVAKITDIQMPQHHLDLWEGGISSNFSIEGVPVKVEVFCHQQFDLISARIQSPLIEKGRLKVEWLFPYAVPKDKHSGYDFASAEKHQSKLERIDPQSVKILRRLGSDHYRVKIHWEEEAKIVMTEKHHFVLSADSGNTITFSCLFSPDTSAHQHIDALPTFAETSYNNQHHWKKFWETSGAVDFSGCTDPRAPELERRFVLSQYLTKIQNSGSLPPQETGLVYNSWYGKFHLEMHWWHSAHFANWNHPEYIAKQLDWYSKIYNRASATARSQGFKGVRWPKMVGPDGQNCPSNIGSFLIWQQPHLIYMIEQLYRSNPSRKLQDKYKDLVFATAEFMADFAVPDSSGVFHLMPPLVPAQEHWNRERALDPPFELSYWHWGLSVAQEWYKRQNGKLNSKWENVRTRLAVPVQENGVYLGVANAFDSYTNPEAMKDHPMVLGTMGILPKWEKTDPEIMRNTLKLVMKKWNWLMTWGWDYPMVAMCATRLNEPEIALEALLKNVQKNTFLPNGHNFQGRDLRIYLPGNGGFLKAVSMMCAGWEGCTTKNPGFPKDGKWNIKWEGLKKDF